MKTARLWLLVFLSLLLPIRGAVAAAMLCPASVGGAQSTASAHLAKMGHHMQAAGGEDHAMHHHGAQERAGHDGSAAEKCNLCSDCCSLTPLLSSPLSLAAPQDFSTISFPDLFAPAPSFVSDGQERPPRST
ncbi:MAG: hypothetical protein ABI605_15370 [Rhizobacter sp.]